VPRPSIVGTFLAGQSQRIHDRIVEKDGPSVRLDAQLCAVWNIQAWQAECKVELSLLAFVRWAT
jgi:hypothetical protein